MRTTEAPTGIAAFVFTDIVSSTKLWGLTASMGPALRMHDQLVRETITEAGGYVFSATGDGFGAAFQVADAAIQASVRIQQRLLATSWPDNAYIAVRIGMHLGRAEERDGNYFGPAVNQSARLMAAADGHQILVSELVKEASAGWLPDEIGLVPLGPVELKDIPHPVEVFSVSAPGVEVAPPPRPPTVPLGQVPEVFTSIVGRGEALDEIQAALVTHRLVSLVGVGGVGKTTLANAVGRRVRGFPGGAWKVSLGKISSGDAVTSSLADALGLTSVNSVDGIIATAMREREMLLIIDNCEHVMPEVVELARAVLERTPKVRILTTSRERLRLPGEQVLQIAPLSTGSEASGHSPAVELFCQRAAEAGAVYESIDELTAIDELCRRLDGLPLAIELAAAKAGALGPDRLLTLLNHRFALLSDHGEGGDGRHQTLEATFAWSYEMLDPIERQVFASLSVLAGRFDVDDALAICRGEDLDELEVINALTSLVERSLVQRTQSSPPYRLLESVREFSLARLEGSDLERPARERHARRFAALAADVRDNTVGPEAGVYADVVFAQARDFEAAARWAAANGLIELALSIVVDLNAFGLHRGWRHGPTWLAELLDDEPSPRPVQWADFVAASAATAVNEFGAARRARELADRALDIDDSNLTALLVRAHVARQADECLAYARRLHEAAVASGQPHWLIYSLVYLGFASLVAGDNESATRYGRTLQSQGAGLDDRPATGWSRLILARALSGTDPARALILLEEAGDIAAECDNIALELSSGRQRVSTLIDGNDLESAEEAIRPILLRTLEVGELDQARRVAALAGMTRALVGDDEVAAQLIGRLGLPIRSPDNHQRYRAIDAALADRMGDQYQLAVEAGRALSIEGAIGLALSALPEQRVRATV